jgi:hypothetical protein
VRCKHNHDIIFNVETQFETNTNLTKNTSMDVWPVIMTANVNVSSNLINGGAPFGSSFESIFALLVINERLVDLLLSVLK